MEGRCCGSLTVFFSFLLPGALLEALSGNKDRAPDGLQHGLRHVGPPPQGLERLLRRYCQGCLYPCKYSRLRLTPPPSLVVNRDAVRDEALVPVQMWKPKTTANVKVF